MADVLAEALVELEPDIQAFSKKLNGDVRRLNRAISASVASTERQFESLGDNGSKEMARIASASEIANRNVLQGWRETAQGFEQVYKDAATGVERSINVSFKSIIRQQEAQTRAAENEIQKLSALAERESRAILRREETQAREISLIVQKFDREREREAAKLAAAQERRAQAVTREFQRVNAEAERQAAKLTEHYENESRKTALVLERNIGGALKNISRTAGRGVLDFSVDTAGLSSAVGQASKLGAILSTLGLGVLAGQAGIGGIAAVVSSLSQTVGVIALLPAAGAAAATSLGVVALGIQGVGEALSETDPTKFAEALTKLAPSARDFARAVRDAQPAAEALQRAIQQELFADFAGEVDRLADVLLPRFQRELVGVASQFNDIGFEFTRFVTSTRTLRDVNRLIERTGKSTDILTAAVEPLLESMRDIGAVGAEFLPRLAADFAEVGIRFGRFIANARDTGALQRFIQNGIDSTKLLISTFGNLGNAIGGVFTASNRSGTSFLETLDEMTERLANVIRSAEGQDTLATFFDSAREVGADLLPLLGQIARVIGGEIAPLLARVGSNVLPAVTRTVSEFGRAINTAAPGITEFSAGFGDFLDMLNAEGVLDTIGKLVNAIGPQLGQALRDVAPVLGEVIVKLGSELTDVLPKLIPRVADFANSFGELLGPALDLLGVVGSIASEVVLPALTKLADTLTPIVDKVVSKVETVLIPMLPKIKTAIDGLITELGPAIDALGDGFVKALELLVTTMPDVIKSMKELVAGIRPILEVIGPVIGGISDLNDSFNSLIDSVPGLRRAIGPGGLFSVITAGLSPITLLQNVHRNISGLAGILVGEWPDATRSFVDSTKRMGDGSSLTFTELHQRATEVLTSIRDQAAEKGVVIADILLNQFGRMKDGSLNIFGDIFAGLSDLFTRTDQKIADQMFGINDKVDAAWNRLRDSTSRAFAETEARISQGINDAVGVVGTFPGAVQNSLGSISSVLIGSGASLINGLIVGIKSREYAAREAAAAVMRVIAGMLPSSPAKEGPFSGRGWTPYRGVALMEGFAQGMMRGLPELHDTAERITRSLSDQLPSSAEFGSRALDSLQSGVRTAESITRLTTADTMPSRYNFGGAPPGEVPTSSDIPPLTVNVRIGERELVPMIVEVIDDTNGRVKRAVTSRARRTL